MLVKRYKIKVPTANSPDYFTEDSYSSPLCKTVYMADGRGGWMDGATGVARPPLLPMLIPEMSTPSP